MYTSASRDERETDDGRRPLSMINAGRTSPSLHRSPSLDSPAIADGSRADVGGVRHNRF